MRILLFSLTYKPFIGGAEIAIDEITKRLPDIRFDIVTLRLDKKLPKTETQNNVTIHRIGWSTNSKIENMNLGFFLSLNKIFFPLTALLKARQLKSKNEYSLMWAMMANYAGFAALFFKTFNPKIPYLLTLQEGDFEDRAAKKVKFIKPLFKKIFTRADHIQVISEYLKDWSHEMGYKKQVSVIPNGVDLDKFGGEIDADTKRHVRTKMVSLFDEKDTILITTSRLVHKNGIDTLIDAMQHLSHDTQLVVLGEGPLLESYKTKAEKVPHKRIHFLGSIPNEVVPLYLKSADIFIRPSRSEGQGISFIEAMAARVPVIATPVGGITDFIFDPKDVSHKATGLFAQVNDPESIAAKVVTYAHDTELADMIVDNAEKLVKEKYDWNLISDQMNNVFKKVAHE